MTTAAQKALEAKAKICQAQAVDIPESPLYHMGNMGVGNFGPVKKIKEKLSIDPDKGRLKSATILQDCINYLTCKAQAKLQFNKDEKEFLIELYKAFSLGGRVKRMPEAAKLARHYVRNTGIAININEKPYTGSVVVKDTMAAIKAYIKDLDANRSPFHIIKTTDISFRQSKAFKPLMLINGSRNKETQGYIKSNGSVHAEQKNERLKKADNRFIIKAMTRKTQHGFTTVWSVDNRYDFEPFSASRPNKYTDIPLNPPLTLPDGLSEYMDSGLNIAKPFNYAAKWTEFW